MKKASILFFSLCCLLLTNCKTEKPTTSLSINLAGTGPDKLEIVNIEKEIYQEITDGKGEITLDISEPILLDLKQRRDHHYIYIRPGNKLSVDTLSTPYLALGVRQNPSLENKTLEKFTQLIQQQSADFGLREIASNGVDTFQLLLQQKFKPFEELMTSLEAEKGIDNAFKAALQQRITSLKGSDLLNYRPMHNYLNQTEIDLPADFYSALEAVDFNDPSLLLFEEGRELGMNWAIKDISFQDYPSVDAYFKACNEATAKKYGNTLLSSYSALENIFNNINFGGGIDGSGPMIDDFKASVTNKYMLTKVDEYIAPWINLKAGLAAPDFVAKKRDDVEVKLSSLKGKKVYIDVWATWCGPCIKEIPALKALEKELHEAPIEFVSISIDQIKDKDKWLEFIDQKELSGLQLFADGDWKSEITTAYNIKGIPRFLLIDEEGKIISANAPRPSDPSIREVLMN